MIPTRDRAPYLEVTLASVMPQAREVGAEVLVVDNGTDLATVAVAERHGARIVRLPVSGDNAARNVGIRAATGDPIVLIDDDVEAPEGWLRAMLDGIALAPDHDVFGGPIRPRLEGGGPRSCGREDPPISALDLGPADRDVPLVWSANMAIRRRGFELTGPFDESLLGRGEEEDWQRRYAQRGGRVRYLAGAGLDHRRTASDSTLRVLARGAYGHGRAARRYDVRKGTAPSLAAELRTLAGCLWHIVRRGCANGVSLAAHSAGRLREALAGWRP